MAPESLKLIEDGGIANYTRRVLEERRNARRADAACVDLAKLRLQLARGLLSLAAMASRGAARTCSADIRAKRITLVVPFSAGGSNDILARAVGQKLSDAWQVPVIIENQVGASGSLGAARVAKAEPDGHTLLILSSTYTINSAVSRSCRSIRRRASRRSRCLARRPMMLAVSKQLPVKNAKGSARAGAREARAR